MLRLLQLYTKELSFAAKQLNQIQYVDREVCSLAIFLAIYENEANHGFLLTFVVCHWSI